MLGGPEPFLYPARPSYSRPIRSWQYVCHRTRRWRRTMSHLLRLACLSSLTFALLVVFALSFVSILTTLLEDAPPRYRGLLPPSAMSLDFAGSLLIVLGSWYCLIYLMSKWIS